MSVDVQIITMDDPRYAAERTLRNEVLLRPIGLADGSWEMRDAEAHHFVAEQGSEVVGCMLCWPLPEEPGTGQLMQMAVAPTAQGRGVGRAIVAFLFENASRIGLDTIVCHAREDAVGFYERLGFVVEGEPFVEVGVRHRHMRIAL